MRVIRSKLLTVGALLAGLGQTALAADPGVADQTLAPDTGLGGGRPWKLTLADYQYRPGFQPALAAQRHPRVARRVYRSRVRISGARRCRHFRRSRTLRPAPTFAAGGD